MDLEAFLFVHRPRTRANCWIILMRSLWHHLIQRLVLCWVMPRKSRRCLRARKLRLSPLNPPALRMKSCRRLWKASRRGLACRGSRPRWRRCGRLDERYLSGHNPPQLKWAFHYFLISMRRLRRNRKSRFPLASIDSSLPVMLITCDIITYVTWDVFDSFSGTRHKR